MQQITSRQNQYVKTARLLKTRKGRLKEGKVLLEGVRLVDDALLVGNLHFCWALVTKEFLDSGQHQGLARRLQTRCPVFMITQDLMEDIADTQQPQGIAAVVEPPEYDLEACLGSHPLILIGDRIADPGNAGTIIRTAAAARASGVVFTPGSVDLYNPKCLRASMGAVFRIPICQEVAPAALVSLLQEHGITLYGATGQGASYYTEVDFRQAVAIALGSEAFGLSPQLESMVAERVAIPMGNGVESLNVAIAAGVLLYEAHRQRYCKG
ncbi:MAG TPA: RNA methyltransferase [Firmicutes bacterium]|nr:RNA methyltransferase [Bacillota bacterium]